MRGSSRCCGVSFFKSLLSTCSMRSNQTHDVQVHVDYEQTHFGQISKLEACPRTLSKAPLAPVQRLLNPRKTLASGALPASTVSNAGTVTSGFRYGMICGRMARGALFPLLTEAVKCTRSPEEPKPEKEEDEEEEGAKDQDKVRGQQTVATDLAHQVGLSIDC